MMPQYTARQVQLVWLLDDSAILLKAVNFFKLKLYNGKFLQTPKSKLYSGIFLRNLNYVAPANGKDYDKLRKGRAVEYWLRFKGQSYFNSSIT